MIRYEDFKPQTAIDAVHRVQDKKTDVEPVETGVLNPPSHKQIAIINGMDLAAGQVTDNAPEDQINGALVLDDVAMMFGTYARWAKPEEIVIMTLVTAGTHFADKEGTLVFRAWPRVLILAPMESGKTRMLTLASDMSRNSSGLLDGGDVTSKGIRNMLNQKKSVFLDEAHLALGNGYGYRAMKSILLHYTNGGGSANGASGITTYNTFGPVFMGAQPALMEQTADRLLDLFSRCFVIIPVYTEDEIPDLDNLYQARAEFVNYELARWAAENRPPHGDMLEPLHGMPKRLRSRKREISAPLIAIADAAPDLRYPEGSDERDRWGIVARNACLELLLKEGDPKRVMERGKKLLADMPTDALDDIAKLFKAA